MQKMILFFLFVTLSFAGFVDAQTSTALIRGAEGLTPLSYYQLSREADLSFQQQNYAKAAEIYERLNRSYPWNGENWQRLGLSLYGLGKFREAVAPLIKAHQFGVSPYPQNNVISIARSYARAGDKSNALLWIEKALRESRYGNRPNLVSDPAFASLKSDPQFVELTGSLPRREFTRHDGWRYDIDHLLSEIKRLNAVYSRQGLPDEVTRAAAHLKTQIPKLSNEQIAFELQHVLALLGQTHNDIFHSAQEPLVRLTQLPLTFYSFPDGLYVVDALAPHEDLIGSKVLRFDNTSAEQALAATEYILSSENAIELHWRGPDQLKILQLLHALKLTSSPSRVKLTVLDRKGAMRSVSPQPVDLRPRPKLNAPNIPGLPNAPLYLSRPDDYYWFEYLPKDETVYLQFNQVRSKREESLAEFGLRLREFLGSNKVRSLIVDVRRNNGGDTYIYPELLRTLIGFDAHRDTRMFVIIGRSTFSAAANFITDLDRLTDAIFVGEPSGGKPITVGGDESPFVLPYSGIRGALSSTSWQLTGPRDARLWITPEIPVSLSAEEYFSNRDPVMETILDLIRHR